MSLGENTARIRRFVAAIAAGCTAGTADILDEFLSA